MNNIFAALSCVSVFAFVDKEGIISEMAKYVDEMAALDREEKPLVLDLAHDTYVPHEEEIYAFENPKLYKDNISLLKALSLAFMCSRNPKGKKIRLSCNDDYLESDTEKQMMEIFTKLSESSTAGE